MNIVCFLDMVQEDWEAFWTTAGDPVSKINLWIKKTATRTNDHTAIILTGCKQRGQPTSVVGASPRRPVIFS